MTRWIFGIVGIGVVAAAGLIWAGLTLSPHVTYRYDPAPATAAAEAYDVTIMREAYGVPHVSGRRDRDAAFGAAFAHAEDDFATIEAALYAARGRDMLAESEDEAIQAYLVQLFRVHELVDERYEKDLSPEARAIMEAYADGINYYAALHPAEISTTLFPATGKDIVRLVAFSSPLFYGMTETLGGLMAQADGRSAGAAGSEDRQVRFFGVQDQRILGSNGLAVGPARSSDGATRLFVNSHQPTDGPLAWYEIRMKSAEGLDFAGGTFPGSPLPFHGHNQFLGWTATVNRPDLIDIYELTVNPMNANQYRLDGSWVDFERREAVMTVKLWGPFAWRARREALWSRHGPVLRTPRGTFALRYATMNTVGYMEQQLRMVKARNLDEFMDALRLNHQGNTNRVYADYRGNLAMFYGARMPKRVPGLDYSGTVPGDRSDLIWTEFIGIDGLPHVINPEAGFITEANSTPFLVTGGPDDPKREDFPPEHGIEERLTNRARRAIDLFGNDPEIARGDFYAYKFDHAYDPDSDELREVRAILALDLSGDETLVTAQDILRRWDMTASAESRAAALALMTAHGIIAARARGEAEPELKAILREVADWLTAHFGRIDVPWGEVNRLVRGQVNLPLNGGPDTLRAVYGERQTDGTLRMTAGDGLIMLVEWDRQGLVRSHSVHHYGSATGRPESPHYADQAPLFAREELKHVPFADGDLEASAVERYRPGERKARAR